VTVIGTAFIAIKPDMAGFAGAVQSGVSKGGTGSKAEKAGKGIGSKFGGALKSAAAIGGVAAVAGVVSFGKASVDAARESEVAQARLGNVFASMGDKTGSATAAAIKYAGVLQKQTAIDDEQIMAAQAKIATFAKVSDTTARQAGIFDRTTKAAADLAAAGFGSMDSNATQLGKALQDPVKGLTALAKSGVTFTASEKARIKVLMESGRQTEAQKMVLGAIEKQVGGTAAATATASDKMKNAWGEAQEQVGSALLPVLDKLAKLMTDTIIPAFAKFAEWLGRNSDVIGPLVAVLGGVALAIKAITIAQAAWNAVADANPVVLIIVGLAALVAALVLAYKKVSWFRTGVDAIWHAFVAAFQFVLRNWQTFLAAFLGPVALLALVIRRNWDTIKGAIGAAIRGVQTAFRAVIGAAKAVLSWLGANWKTILAVITGPIGMVVLLVTKNWDTIKAAVSAAVDFIIGIVTAGFRVLAGIVSGVWSGLRAATAAVWGAIRVVVQTAVGWVTAFFNRQVNGWRAIFAAVWNALRAVTSAVWSAIRAVIGTAVGWVTAFFNRQVNGWRRIISAAWNAIRAITSAIWNAIRSVVSSVVGGITGAVSRMGSVVRSTFSSAWNAAYGAVRGAISRIVGAVSGLPGRVLALAGRMVSAGASIGSSLLNGLRNALSAAGGIAGDIASALVSAVRSAWNTFAGRVNSIIPNKLGWGPASIDLPDNPIPTFGGGGLVPGRLGAPLLAIVHGGEFVTPARQVAGAGGPAVAIASATFNEPVDVDLLVGRVGLALAAGRL
jgi:phage-related protein